MEKTEAFRDCSGQNYQCFTRADEVVFDTKNYFSMN